MPLGGQVPCRRHSDLQAGTSMAWYSCSEESLRKRRLCQKLSGKLRTLATGLQRRTPATETPNSIASFPSASFRGAGMVPFSLPSDSLPCLPGLVITESPRLCLLARPLDSTVVQTMSRKEAGHWQAGGFFYFQEHPQPLWKSSQCPRKESLLSQLTAKVMCSTGLSLSTGSYLICKLFLALVSEILVSTYL